MVPTLLRALCALPVLATLGAYGQSAENSPARAVLQVKPDRVMAPDFDLRDSSGRRVTLSQHRGKVVLLDFWATYCGGCRKELPWFAEFQRTYRPQGFSVVAVALDEEGWAVVKPFLTLHKLALCVALGDEALTSRYGVKEMPNAFLIDRKGRVAANYVGLADRADMESNITALLAER